MPLIDQQKFLKHMSSGEKMANLFLKLQALPQVVIDIAVAVGTNCRRDLTNNGMNFAIYSHTPYINKFTYTTYHPVRITSLTEEARFLPTKDYEIRYGRPLPLAVRNADGTRPPLNTYNKPVYYMHTIYPTST